MDRDEFRKCADPVFVRACVDLVADREPRHARAHCDNLTGQVIAQDERHPVRQDRLEISVPCLEVERVDARRANPDEDVIIAYCGSGTSPARTVSASP
jgi:hypothetical protein